jgi:hypothetical protein
MHVDKEKPASDLFGSGIAACRLRADPPTHRLMVESDQKDSRGLAVVSLVGIGNLDDAGIS